MYVHVSGDAWWNHKGKLNIFTKENYGKKYPH